MQPGSFESTLGTKFRPKAGAESAVRAQGGQKPSGRDAPNSGASYDGYGLRPMGPMDQPIPNPGSEQSNAPGIADPSLEAGRTPHTGPNYISAAATGTVDLEEANTEVFDAGAVRHSLIGGQIKYSWERNKLAKQITDGRLLACLRMRKGMYSPSEMSEIMRSGANSTIYMNVASTKCSALASWLKEILLAPGDRPCGLEPRHLPQLPPEIADMIAEGAAAKARQVMVEAHQQGGPAMDEEAMKELAYTIADEMEDDIKQATRKRARIASEKMEQTVFQQMDDGGFDGAFAEYIEYFATYPTAFLKGPYNKRTKQLKWIEPLSKGADWRPLVETATRLYWKAISPFDCYPAPLARDCQDRDFIERMRLSYNELFECIGIAGYDEEAIRWACEQHQGGLLRNWIWTDAERARLENDTTFDWFCKDDLVDALHYWGSIEGRKLINWGVTSNMGEIDPQKRYEVDAILIGTRVVRCVINDDPLGRRPYRHASYEEIPGSIWGRAVPELCASQQDGANAAARNMVNNMGIACLTGDTVVYRHERPGAKRQRKYNGRSRNEVTINELWEIKQRRRNTRTSVVRCLNEDTGEFFGNELVDVHFNGIRPIYRMTTEHGYTIKATMDHRFMADDGKYKYLENLSVGDMVAVNGSVVPLRKTCVDCDAALETATAMRCTACNMRKAQKTRWAGHQKADPRCMDCDAKISDRKGAKRCRKCCSKFENNSWNQQQALAAVENGGALGTTSRGRKLWRDGMLDACQACATTERLELHHIDRNPMNCEPGNRMTLCGKCHKAWHARHDNYGKNPFLHTFVDYDRIISIEYVGEDRVFDLQMNAPHHNFVANGLVSHNCGPQVGINSDRLPPNESITQMYPWKIWQFNKPESGQTGAAAQPIQFFQPQSNAQELWQVYQGFLQDADDATGIPRYSYGDEKVGGAGATMGGLSMLMGAAARRIRRAIGNIDQKVLAETVYDVFVWCMLHVNDPQIKGDCNVIPKGSAALLIKEQMQRGRQEGMQLVLGNPLVQKFVGLNGIADLLREYFKGLHFPSDFIPQGAELQKLLAGIQQQMANPPPPPQVISAQSKEKIEGAKLQQRDRADAGKNQTALAVARIRHGSHNPDGSAGTSSGAEPDQDAYSNYVQANQGAGIGRAPAPVQSGL